MKGTGTPPDVGAPLETLGHDIDPTKKELDRLAQKLSSTPLPRTVLLDEVKDFYDCADRMAQLWKELNLWLVSGGTLPTAWRNEVTEGNCEQ